MPSLTELPVATKKLSDSSSRVAVSDGLSISKTTSGEQTLLPAVEHARIIVAFVFECTEDYTSDSGTQAAWDLGETDALTRWNGHSGVQDKPVGNATVGANFTDLPNSGSTGALRSGGCILAANKEIIVTCTAATGDGTGGCKLVVITVNAP